MPFWFHHYTVYTWGGKGWERERERERERAPNYFISYIRVHPQIFIFADVCFTSELYQLSNTLSFHWAQWSLLGTSMYRYLHLRMHKHCAWCVSVCASFEQQQSAFPTSHAVVRGGSVKPCTQRGRFAPLRAFNSATLPRRRYSGHCKRTTILSD
jgi:hypothetical protein